MKKRTCAAAETRHRFSLDYKAREKFWIGNGNKINWMKTTNEMSGLNENWLIWKKDWLVCLIAACFKPAFIWIQQIHWKRLQTNNWRQFQQTNHQSSFCSQHQFQFQLNFILAFSFAVWMDWLEINEWSRKKAKNEMAGMELNLIC